MDFLLEHLNVRVNDLSLRCLLLEVVLEGLIKKSGLFLLESQTVIIVLGREVELLLSVNDEGVFVNVFEILQGNPEEGLAQ